MRSMAHRMTTVVSLALAAAAARAQAPLDASFTYQGKLEGSSGPANGSFDMRFALYDALSGGAFVASTCRDNVVVVDGLFTVSLDLGGGSFSTDQQRFLQIEVRADSTLNNCNGGSFTLLTPRQPITATPFALKVLGVDGHSLDAADGSPADIVYVDNNGLVGVGTMTPQSRLHVNGVDNNGTSAPLRITSGPQIMLIDGNELDAVNDTLYLNNNTTSNVVLASGGGSVGIGTMNPQAVLDVASGGGSYIRIDRTYGDLHANGGTDGLFGIYNDSGASGRTEFVGQGVPRLVVVNSGNVGIGTTSPAARFHVDTAATDYPAALFENGGAGVSAHGLEAVTFSTTGGSDQGSPSGVRGVVALGGGGFSAGVRGVNQNTNGLGVGVLGYHNGSGYGVYGRALNSTSGYAGYFSGRVAVSGNLSKGGGSFKIDHPLDPANKYLYHSFVESPDMKNIYDGVATLDAAGRATVEMPAWFDALNRDFRYQLTPIGAAGPNLHVAQELADRRFVIAGGTAGMKVSWQITGVRQDAYANANRIPVEEDKPTAERGRFLHPEAFGLSHAESIEQAMQAAE